jgi:DNA-binding HxlR family transcriptional regulator
MKGQRTTHSESQCAVARALDSIGDWWSLLIVREAMYGKTRFNEFQKSLGLAKNILATRLRKLVECGVMEMADAPDNGAHKVYLLSAKGEQLYIVMVALQQWGAKYCFERGEQPIALVDRVDQAPLSLLEVRAHDQRVLGPRDIGALEPSGERPARKRPAVRGGKTARTRLTTTSDD